MNDAIEDCKNASCNIGALPLGVLIGIALNRCVHPSQLIVSLERISVCRSGTSSRLNELMIQSDVTWSDLIENSISRR